MQVVEINRGRKFEESYRIGLLTQEYGRKLHSEKIYLDGLKMASCGRELHVYKKVYISGKVAPQLQRNSCHVRGCNPCAEVRQKEYRKRIDTIIRERGEKNFLFVTATTRRRVPIDKARGEFDFMSHELSNLVRTGIIKEMVVGGFRALEGNSNDNGMINVHAHFLIEVNGEDLSKSRIVLKFLKSPAYQDRLKAYLKNNPDKTKKLILQTTCRYLKKGRFTQLMWSALFYSRGLGAVCNVQEVSKFKNPGKSTSEELIKYMTKSMKLTGSNLPEFLLAMRGKRAFSSWGSLKITQKELDKIKVDENEGRADEEEEEEFTLSYVGSIEEVARRAVEENNSFCQQAIGLALKENFIDIEIGEGD